MSEVRSILELLNLVYNSELVVKGEMLSTKKVRPFCRGFCSLLNYMLSSEVISFIEYRKLSRYIMLKGKPKWYNPLHWKRFIYYKRTKYYWKKHDWVSRKAWLFEEIDKLTNV